MFTGLITNTTTVVALDHHASGGTRLSVTPFGEQLHSGDSVALDGCCLTIMACEADKISFDLSHATLQRTTFVDLKQGQLLNVELPLCLGDCVHGHLVSGHVDAVTEVLALEGTPARGLDLTVAVPAGYEAQLFPQAAVALNGVSLTIAALHNDAHGKPTAIKVCLIPETCQRTNLAKLAPTQRVNFESDMLGKYIARSVTAWRTNRCNVIDA